MRAVRHLSMLTVLLVITATPPVAFMPSAGVALAQQAPQRFGGAYSELDPRRQDLVDNWVVRFAKATGQSVQPGPFYDEVLSMSAKTTFDAVTHALLTTSLTDAAGTSLGDALALVAEVDTVKGEVIGTPGDRQFRVYARLTDDAASRLDRSQQFDRGLNSIYHPGYPLSYRAQGGVPSIQISLAADRKRADIDVDYRAGTFPTGLFNGHLTSANSDVRAGNNFDRHVNRWLGLQNWWHGFLGVRQERAPEADTPGTMKLPSIPRAGKATVDVMVRDFLNAWLVEGDIVAALSYLSDRAYACMARESQDPANFDRGVAPFQLMANLRSARESLGPRSSLADAVVGTRLVIPALRVVRQPNHARFVLYGVPDDVAPSFDCQEQITPGPSARAARTYGNYFGATFNVADRSSTPVALLWAQESGYWKIVSWKVGMDTTTLPGAEPTAAIKLTQVPADPTFVTAAKDFLDGWLVRKDYDAAFGYVSPKAYQCFNLERDQEQPPATSDEDAGRRLRENLAAAATRLSTSRKLEDTITAAVPSNPAIRLVNHRDARTFALLSLPNGIADASECAARVSRSALPDQLSLEYGNAFGTAMRFRTRGGEAPVLKLLWRKESAGWRITAYDIEQP